MITAAENARQLIELLRKHDVRLFVVKGTSLPCELMYSGELVLADALEQLGLSKPLQPWPEPVAPPPKNSGPVDAFAAKLANGLEARAKAVHADEVYRVQLAEVFLELAELIREATP